MRTMIAVLAAPLLLLNANGVAEAQEAKPPKPTTIIKCEEASTGGTAPVYDGKSASYMYDERFKPSLHDFPGAQRPYTSGCCLVEELGRQGQ